MLAALLVSSHALGQTEIEPGGVTVTPTERTTEDGPAGDVTAVQPAEGKAEAEPQVMDAVTVEAEVLPPITVTADPSNEIGYVATQSTTATKTDTPLTETPQSISVITKDQLDSQEADTLGEALRYSAGIKGETFGLEDRGFDTFVDIRGFTSPIFATVCRLIPHTETYLAEWIEILRGPASVLYGQGSPGGIVNYVTKRPLDIPFRELVLEAASFDRFEGKFDLSNSINEDGTLAYRFTGLATTSDAQVDFIERDRVVIAPALTWRPNDDTTLTFLSSYNKDDVGTSSNSFLPAVGTVLPNPNGRIPPNRFTGEENFNSIEREQYSMGHLLDHQAGGHWSFRQNVRYDDADLDFTGLFGGGLNAADPTQRSLTRSGFSALTDARVFSIDNQAQVNFDTGPAAHTLLVGLDHQSLDFDEQLGQDVAASLDPLQSCLWCDHPHPAFIRGPFSAPAPDRAVYPGSDQALR